ncbi:hypothetical protein ES703_112435 [subsurface metagenome]
MVAESPVDAVPAVRLAAVPVNPVPAPVKLLAVTVPVAVIAAAPTVPVNVGLADKTTEPVPVDVVVPVPPLRTGRVPDCTAPAAL